MQTFKDAGTGQFWQFDDDVQVIEEDGRLSFYAPSGQALVTPPGLVPHALELPGEPTAAVPLSVSRYQARAALLEAGMLADVEAYFSALPDTSIARLAWQEAPTVNRNSDALVAAANDLGLTDAQLDALFMRADQFV